jgi:hypothetical protein
MKTTAALLFLIVMAACLFSCGGTISCQNQPISLAFNRFDSFSLTRVILIKYKKNTDFTEVIDSVFSGTSSSQYAIDSTGLKINNLTYSVINPDYDYVVYVYYNQRQYKIRGVTFHPKTTHTHCKLCENTCKNDLSFYVNDSLYNYVGDGSKPPYVHIYR